MLQLQNICKSYTTGTFTQKALDDVTIAFRDNEFVAILGPSGSGKTTLLNIVGGLDHYDSGDLIIEGVSTKQYKDRDWDAYRNNRIGFVFQSYNLIPHQTVLANVELALTLSGVSREERRKRAAEALERVGLAEHIDKKPSQLSGGQMQRVAIARALINDPEILLADEPTGALDSKTSVQIMDLLTEIAADRLVIMVTHNPELAEQYATRTVNLADGAIVSDTDPYLPSEEEVAAANAKPVRRTRMSFLTALSLSANNLLTKKGRTIMTAIAGSIGIIGIAAILALANGVNNYIKTVEEETLSVYPLQILSTGFDMTTMLVGQAASNNDDDDQTGEEASQQAASASGSASSASAAFRTYAPEDGLVGESRMMSRMFASIGSNDLAALKVYLDSGESGIEPYVNSIYYEYSVTPQIYDANTEGEIRQINPDTSFASLGFGSGVSNNSIMSMSMSTDMFAEMMEDNQIVEGQYDVVAGHWPENYDECVLVVSQSGRISDFLSYVLGLRDQNELKEMVRQFSNEEDVIVPEGRMEYTYEQIMDVKMKLVHAVDRYQYDADYNVWVDKSDDKDYMKALIDRSEDLHIVGIVRPKEDANGLALRSGLYYKPSLTRHIVEHALASDIVKSQLADSKRDVFSGKTFDQLEEEDEESSFDMSSLFTIDENAIANSFTFNASALNLGSIDPSQFDLSGIDPSSIDMSDVPPLDMSGIADDIMPTMTPEDYAALFPELTGAQLAQILSSIDVKFTDGGQAANAALSNITQGYIAWSMANPGKDVSEYMQQPEVQAQLVAVGGTIDTADLQQQLTTAIAGAMGTTAADLPNVISQRIANAYAEQMGAALQQRISAAMQEYMTQVMTKYMEQVSQVVQTQVTAAMNNAMRQLAGNIGNAIGFDASAFANAFQFNMDEKELAELMASMMRVEEHSYDSNLKKLGYADFAKPFEISIYPKDFESKESILEILDDYNAQMRATDEDKVINYTDIVGALMSSVTDIVNMISTVLIAFVAISLIVSSIMIGVITYISVLERKKEIGILRSIGASKGDISRVFNAETVIEGLIAGLLGVGVTALACIPANAIVYATYDVPNVALLPPGAAVVLVIISVVLTFIAGLIPSRSASRKDPVEALRSE